MSPTPQRSSPVHPSAPRLLTILVAFLLLVGSAHSCGPFFPLWLLDGGDRNILNAPVAQFTAELHRLGLAPRAPQGPDDGGFTPPNQVLALELEDLQRALARAQMTPEKAAACSEAWKKFRGHYPLHAAASGSAPRNPDTALFSAAQHLADLPPEFLDYAQGVEAWARSSPQDAHQHWSHLLQRPEAERREKSVWASYMLGRIHSQDGTPREEVNAFYQQCRTLAQSGFSDSQGLALESLGWEAQLLFQAHDFQGAILLYLQQLARNHPTAAMSLYMTASKALEKGSDQTLLELVQHPQCRPVISAYTISDQSRYDAQREHYPEFQQKVKRWLNAAEQAEVQDLSSAEVCAVAAYRAGDDKLARRWILRAPRSLTSQWLTAKLWIKAGNLNKACESLRQVTRAFPQESRNNRSLLNTLMLPGEESGEISAAHLLQGELGVLLLARKEYIDALHALILGDFWMDAAYVAERVLTLDELQRYVTTFWREEPLPTSESITDPQEQLRNTHHLQIHALLARRMFREGRGRDAIPYFPERHRAEASDLVDQLDLAHSAQRSPIQRAEAWWKAARITRWSGIDLIATEVEPDWAYHGGSYEAGVTFADRKALPRGVTRPSPEELQRAAKHAVEPAERYHYRYLAAAMAWEAAQLMPDQSNNTALVLCIAGSWIKNRSPKTADSFYKALAKRCSKTDLGKEAHRKRWFPSVSQDDEASVTFR